MPNAASWYGQGNSYTSTGGGAGGGGGVDPSAYIMALIQSEDAYKKRQLQAATAASRYTPVLGARQTPPPMRMTVDANPEMGGAHVQSLIGGAPEGMEPYYVSYPSGPGMIPGPAMSNVPGPGTAFGGYRSAAATPKSGNFVNMGGDHIGQPAVDPLDDYYRKRSSAIGATGYSSPVGR